MGNTRIDQAARAKARQRRLDMEHDRAARDTRIEHAAAAVFTALAVKEQAEQDVHAAEERIGQSLRRLLQEGLTSTLAAQLCDLPPTAVQRLLRRRPLTPLCSAPCLWLRDARKPAVKTGRSEPTVTEPVMTDPIAALRGLDLIATLITHALEILETETPARANGCAIQAGAAVHAIASVERDISTDQAPVAVAIGLDPSDARYIAAAALHVAIHAPTVLIDPPATRAEHVLDRDARTATWFAVRNAIRATQPHPRPTTFAPLVADFVDAFRRTFASGDGASPALAGTGSLTQATSYRALLNRLPELADGLARSAARWGTIPARTEIPDVEPIPRRDHTGVQRYAAIRLTLLTATVSAAIAQAAMAAARASALAAAHADTSAGRVGQQPHPRLVQMHLDRVRQPKPTHVSRWDPVVSDIDHRITADAWPVLARVLDLAAGDGWDVRAHLRQIATDLPTAQPAAELAYRILADRPLEPSEITPPPATPNASDDDIPSPPIAVVRHREPAGPAG